jgi:hypothetical protein
MTPFFLNPWSMVLGGVLIASPIIIHLINRMRFRRLRWAAMEFLLKSQKKMRRKLIIEQLILLLLRILLVLLAGLLLARFLLARSSSDEGVTHFILIDDTFSMTDVARGDKTGSTTAFEKAKAEVGELTKNLARAATPQHLCVAVLSDPQAPFFDQDLKSTTQQELLEKLELVKPTALHVEPEVGVRAGRFYLQKVARGSKVFHLFGDFREQDWVTGPGADGLAKEVDQLIDASINVNFMDTVHQYRAENRGEASGGHENLAVVDLRAEKRVVAENEPVDFYVTIENFGNLARPSFLKVRINGVEWFGATQPISSLPAMQRTEIKFPLLFAKLRGGEAVSEKDSAEERDRKRRAESEFQTVSVEIDDDEGGLLGDNVRDLVIEVRRKIPLLVIDGNDNAIGTASGSDYDHLREAFRAAKAYEVERRTPKDLVTTDLDLYPTVFLTNVSQITDEPSLKKLQDYAKNGGSLVFCMGDKTIAGFYNNKLHKELNGLFPVMISNAATPALEEKQRDDMRFSDPQRKLILPPMDREFSPELNRTGLQGALRYLLIERYYPTLDKSQWTAGADKATVLAYLANRKPMGDFALKAQELLNQATNLVDELKDKEPEYEKYVGAMQRFRTDLRNALGTAYLYNLGLAFDIVLRDPGVKDDATKPSMPDLWAHRKMRRLARDMEEFRKSVEYGDPLVVANNYGKGKVVAFLTTAGTLSKWNDWGGGSIASITYPVFMMDLQRYLISESEGLNRKVGVDPVVLEFDSRLYDSSVAVRYKAQKATPAKKEGDTPAAAPDKDAPKPDVPVLKTVTMHPAKDAEGKTRDDVLELRYTDFKDPGVYTFEVKPLGGAGDKAVPQARSYAFNIDAEHESDLKRAATAKLLRDKAESKGGKGKITVRSPGEREEVVKQKEPDASELPWLFLIILVVLVAEQAMAVHLSFHLKGGEASVAPPAPRPAAA